MEIVIVSPIHPSALARLCREHEVVRCIDPSREQLLALIASCEALVFRSGITVDDELFAAAPRLRLLVRAGAGTDNVDRAAAEARGIELVTIPGPGAQAVAEMAFALMLALARNVVVADGLTKSGRWAKHELTGQGLHGKTLGVIGTGSIGSRVGWLGAAWGMDVLGSVEHPSRHVARELAGLGIGLRPTDEVLSKADFVSLHVPLKASTRNLIDAAALRHMKPTAFLINLARGGVVDEGALAQALREGRLAGAALDVHADEGEGMQSPLAGLPNAILTPHIGAGTVDAQVQIGQQVVRAVNRHASSPDAALVARAGELELDRTGT